MARDKPSSEDLIRQAKESLRSLDSSPTPVDVPIDDTEPPTDQHVVMGRTPPVDVPIEETEPPADQRTVTERMIDEAQIDQPPAPAPARDRPRARAARSVPKTYTSEPRPRKPAEEPPPVLMVAPTRKPRKGRVRRFFGWIVLIVIALFWIGMLSVLGDESDIVVSIGIALLVTVIPAFVGMGLIGAGTDQEPEPTLAPELEREPRKSGFLRFIAWLILALTAFAWIVLILDLIDDPSGILGIVLGGLVISVIPTFVALILMSDGDALAVEEQDDTSVD